MSDAHEGINEMRTGPNDRVANPQPSERAVAQPAGKEDPGERDAMRMVVRDA